MGLSTMKNEQYSVDELTGLDPTALPGPPARSRRQLDPAIGQRDRGVLVMTEVHHENANSLDEPTRSFVHNPPLLRTFPSR